jgi:hypothetical protein
MKNQLLLLTILLFFAACKPYVSPESLYGKWKYTRVRHPNASPTDTIGSMALLEQKPYIQFTKQDSLLIYWDDKQLSHGTFKIDGHDIRYKEILADGTTREFPFYVEDFNGKQIIFSTKGTDGSEVTAVKE